MPAKSPRRWSDYEKWIKADHLKGKSVVLTIARMEEEETHPRPGATEISPVLYFRETRKGLVLSPTNQEALGKLFGDEIEKCIGHGATRMRPHVEVDPKVGLRGFEGVKALIDTYKWAIDIEVCVMPQEGLTNNPGTDELMVAALKNGATVVGAAPNYDSDRAAQIRRVFEMAREFDVDIDMEVEDAKHATMLMAALRANPSVDNVDRGRG